MGFSQDEEGEAVGRFTCVGWMDVEHGSADYHKNRPLPKLLRRRLGGLRAFIATAPRSSSIMGAHVCHFTPRSTDVVYGVEPKLNAMRFISNFQAMASKK